MTDYALALSDTEVLRYRMMAARAAEAEAELWRLAGIVPGAVVADVGCGPAAAAVEMAKAVGPDGRVIGVEREPRALQEAAALVAAAGADNVELRAGEATAPGLEAGSVDVAVMRHVLAHIGGSEQAAVAALAELVRPGGCVYLVDVDLTAVRAIDSDPDMDDAMQRYAEFHRRRGGDPHIGLRLGAHLRAAGLEVVAHEGRYSILQPPPGLRPPMWAAREAMVAEGVATAEDVARWDAAYTRMDAAAVRPTIFSPQFIAIGRRPA